MKIIKSFRNFSINEELSDVPVDGFINYSMLIQC
jgi:hypothetical protein